ncbi:MAG TPA: amidohydrolase family protein [Thermoanaerobaculia bacterium]|nr:amidohydrolase family protein [Thermoanaerobaculia bacterium]
MRPRQTLGGTVMDTHDTLHVILGAGGAIGTPLAAELLDRGRRLRTVSRTGRGAGGAEVFSGDLTNPGDALRAVEEGAMVYLLAGLPYDKRVWREQWPAIMGNVLAGSSAVMRLHGWNWTDMTLRAPIGMHLYYPRLARLQSAFFSQTEKELQKQKEKALKAIGEIFDAARAYKTAREAALAGKAPAVEVDPRHEAMRPVLDGKLPLFIHAREKSQIESALDWAKREKLANLVLITGADAQYVAERLAKEKVPVILDGVLELPDRRWEPYDAAYAAAARLNEAGVKLAIGGGRDAANARNLPFHAAMAASFGLPREAALRSVTLAAAELLGVADRIGSLDPGKEASLFVADGDPLEIETHIERVWIAGQEIDLARERQRELYERYRNRPKPAPPAAAAPAHP